MKICLNCGTQISDDSHFCTECGKPIPQDKVCPHCRSSVGEGDVFCQNCGKNLKEPFNGEPIAYEDEEIKSGFKKSILFSFGVMMLFVICGGGWWFSNNNVTTNETFETMLVTFKKTVPTERLDVEVEINVDYPIKGNPILIKNITSLLIDALNNDFKDEQSPHFDGEISNGQALVDFYGNNKIKELQEQGIGSAQISILKTYETDWVVSYTVDFGGNNGGVGFGTTYGMSFNKADGTIIQVVKDPNNSDFKNFLISKVLAYLKANENYDLAVELELKDHPFPMKAPYLTKDGVCFIYQKYEIGCGGLGEVTVVIPYNIMRAYMSDTALSFIELSANNVQSEDSLDDVEEENVEDNSNLDWLQGHWVYEQGNYNGHFVIQGNTITQYCSMNPEPEKATFRIEDGVIRAKIIDGLDLVIPIDYANHRIDYGDGRWMHKTMSDNNGNTYSGSTSSMQSRTFANEQYVAIYLANQIFENSSGVNIRIDGDLNIYIGGYYAGVISVLRYNSTSALLRYGGGVYGEGKIIVRIESNGLQLNDPLDGTIWYQK